MELIRMHELNMACRRSLKDKKRIVVKVGSSSLLHKETGRVDYHRIDTLARELSDIKNQGKEVILVSSGATAVGREVVRNAGADSMKDESPITVKQACAAVGQARLMMLYQKFFDDYNQISAQILMDRNSVRDNLSKYNLRNTFTELLKLNTIPVVNENDSISSLEYRIGDNDTLSAMVASLVGADLLILLSDVDGLYSDDPRHNKDAQFIEYVEHVDDSIMELGKSTTGSNAGTGGMHTKLVAANIATKSGCDMIICNCEKMDVVGRVMSGENIGTFFREDHSESFDLQEYAEMLE